MSYQTLNTSYSYEFLFLLAFRKRILQSVLGLYCTKC